MEMWIRIRGAIMDAGQEVDCRTIMDWLRDALTKKVEDDKLPFAMPRPTAPLADGNLLRHLHHMLNQHLPELDPSLQSVQGSLIATHVGEVTVEFWCDRE